MFSHLLAIYCSDRVMPQSRVETGYDAATANDRIEEGRRCGTCKIQESSVSFHISLDIRHGG